MTEPVLTISEFCEANRLSRSTYYALKRTGEGPLEMKISAKRRVITPEANVAWRRQRQGRQELVGE